MSEYIRHDILTNVSTDLPLPISQAFIDDLNRLFVDKPESPRDEVLAEATLTAIALLEIRLGKLMEAIGVSEAD